MTDEELTLLHIRQAVDGLPAAQRHLTDTDWDEINAAFSENRDPRFSGDTETEFKRLFSRIVNIGTSKTKKMPHGWEDRRKRYERAIQALKPVSASELAQAMLSQ